jgi:glycerol-3-phosphate dehydrogenase
MDIAYLEVGLKLYDWIAGRDGLAPSEFISREEALRRMPTLAAEKLAGAVVYADGQFDDARYNLALVESFTEAGGEALNYARVTAFEKDAHGTLTSATVQTGHPPQTFTIRARAFLNATGPRADAIRTMATPGVAPRMRPSKGVHICCRPKFSRASSRCSSRRPTTGACSSPFRGSAVCSWAPRKTKFRPTRRSNWRLAKWITCCTT